MLIGPVIFCTVVLGIAGAGDMKKVGRVGGKAIVYFEVVSRFALLIGLIVANVVRPGEGFNVDPATLDANAVAGYAKAATEQSTVEFLLSIIPSDVHSTRSPVRATCSRCCCSRMLFGYAMVRLGQAGEPVHRFIETRSQIFFAMMNTIM